MVCSLQALFFLGTGGASADLENSLSSGVQLSARLVDTIASKFKAPNMRNVHGIRVLGETLAAFRLDSYSRPLKSCQGCWHICPQPGDELPLWDPLSQILFFPPHPPPPPDVA